MVTVRLASGRELEITDSKITYIKSSGDLGEITEVNSSYSWSMKFPKTPQNTQTLQGLGLVGSTSRRPYEKIYCDLLDNGMPIVKNGLLNIKETDKDYYGIYIQEGYVDFLRDIKTDTLGQAIDLTDLDHVRDLGTIISTFGGSEPYIYLIADFNGGYLANISDTTNMDVLYMIPFANVGYILDKIFDNYGWTYDMDAAIQAQINSRWMSYPSEIVYDDSTGTQAMEADGTNIPLINQTNGPFLYDVILPNRTLDPAYFLSGSPSQFIAQQDGNYQFTLLISGHVTHQGGVSAFQNRIYINGVYKYFIGNSNDNTPYTLQIPLFSGDVVMFVGYANYGDQQVFMTSGDVTAIYLQQGQVSFTRAFIKYKVSDFLKEILTRFSLTPFVDSKERNIEFLTLDERLNADIVDWSDKHAGRVSETYLYRNYAQNNYFRHKYHRDGDDYNDGNIQIPNENLEVDKDLFQSQSYSPDEQFTVFLDSDTPYEVPKMRMFDVEIKEEGATLVATYTRLKDRFYFASAAPLNRDIYIDGFIQDDAPVASVGPSLFSNIIADKYSQFSRITTNAKVHSIKLALSQVDILHLDLKKKYYFAQEAGYYILNRLKWVSGELSTGEFLRIE